MGIVSAKIVNIAKSSIDSIANIINITENSAKHFWFLFIFYLCFDQNNSSGGHLYNPGSKIKHVMHKNSALINIAYFALTVIIIATPAFITGYPLVYLDSHNYIGQSINLASVKTNPIGYALFIRAFSWQASLWTVVLAQALLYSLLLFFTLKTLNHFRNLYVVHFTLILILTLFTSMGYIASLIMADFFAPILILSVYLLFARNNHIGVKILAFSGILMSGLSHFSTQLEVIVLFFVLLIFLKLLRSYNLKQYLYRGSLLVLAFILSLSINYAFYHSKYKDDKQGGLKHVIIMARLVESGILDEYLEHNCDDGRYALCEYKGKFPKRASEFVWTAESPFYKTGGWNNSKEEYREIIANVFTSPYYLGMFTYKGIISGFKQLVSFRAGYIHVKPDMRINNSIASNFPHEYKDFQRSRQQYGENLLPNMNMMHYILTAISLLLIFALIKSKKEISTNLNNLILIILLGVLFNALITGSIGGAIDRYQARVNWLIVFLGMTIAIIYIQKIVGYLKSLDLPKKKD